MRKFLKALAVAVIGVAAFLAGPTPVADAQVYPGLAVQPLDALYFGNQVSAADTEPVLVIKYFSGANTTTTATTVAVEADGNLTFVVNSAAYAGIECPVSGDVNTGIIDVSDGACNTLGEVVDAINSSPKNFSTGYFRAAIVNGLRSDSSDDSFLADAADAEVRSAAGEVVYWDSSTLDDNTVAGNFDQTVSQLANQFLNFSVTSGNVGNPFKGQNSVLLYSSETITNAGTVGNFVAYCAVDVNPSNGGSTITANLVGSSVERVIYTEAGAATTNTGTMSELLTAGGFGCNDGRVVVRIEASGADTSAVALFASGYRYTRR